MTEKQYDANDLNSKVLKNDDLCISKQNIENKVFDIEKLYELDYLVTDNLETKGVFISDHLDIEQDLISEEDYDSEQKRNRYIINLRKIKDVREDLEK